MGAIHHLIENYRWEVRENGILTAIAKLPLAPFTLIAIIAWDDPDEYVTERQAELTRNAQE